MSFSKTGIKDSEYGSDQILRRSASEEESVFHMVQFRPRSRTVSDIGHLRKKQSHRKNIQDVKTKRRTGDLDDAFSIDREVLDARLKELLRENFRNLNSTTFGKDALVSADRGTDAHVIRKRSNTISGIPESRKSTISLRPTKSMHSEEGKQKTGDIKTSKVQLRGCNPVCRKDQPLQGEMNTEARNSSFSTSVDLLSDGNTNIGQNKNTTSIIQCERQSGSSRNVPDETKDFPKLTLENQGQKIPEIRLLFRDCDDTDGGTSSCQSRKSSDAGSSSRPRAYTLSVPSMQRPSQVTKPDQISLYTKNTLTVDTRVEQDENFSSKTSLLSPDYGLSEIICQSELRSRARSYTMSDSATLRKIRAKLSSRLNVSIQSSENSETDIIHRKESSSFTSFKPCPLDIERPSSRRTSTSDILMVVNDDGLRATPLASFSAPSKRVSEENDTTEETLDIPELKSPFDGLSNTFQREKRLSQKRNVWFKRSQRRSLSPHKTQRQSVTNGARPAGFRGILYDIRLGMRSLLCSASPDEESKSADTPPSRSPTRARIGTPFPKDLDQKRKSSGVLDHVKRYNASAAIHGDQ